MKDAEPVIARARAERRRFKRVPVDLQGRLFVPAESREARCRIVDLSPGGAAIECEIVPPPNTDIVVYIDGFGRIEGTVARHDPAGGFGVRFNCTPLKRERIAEQLTLFLNQSLAEGAVMRRSERAQTKGFARFTRADGQLVTCEVLDLSTSGVSLKSEVKPPVGEYVLIGQMAGRVVRHHETGIGIEFVGGTATDRANPDRVQTKLTAVR